jgi:fatty acid desaturase
MKFPAIFATLGLFGSVLDASLMGIAVGMFVLLFLGILFGLGIIPTVLFGAFFYAVCRVVHFVFSRLGIGYPPKKRPALSESERRESALRPLNRD